MHFKRVIFTVTVVLTMNALSVQTAVAQNIENGTYTNGIYWATRNVDVPVGLYTKTLLLCKR